MAALLVDAVGPGVTMARTAGWGCLATVLVLVLFPPRISLAPGRLVVRGLFTTTVIHTDQLSALQWPADVSERVVLTDVRGSRAQLDFCLLSPRTAEQQHPGPLPAGCRHLRVSTGMRGGTVSRAD
ncbi:hypothetical protein ACIF6H_36225 [Streptomyces microflavus]|uniref:hypothetical protein n=1 Tax=Streptomyces microflavus TaxID=1919 RepID=UPI0037CE2149